MRKLVLKIIDIPILPLGLLMMIFSICYYLLKAPFKTKSAKPRLLWGSTPIKSLSYLSNALSSAGYFSQSIVIEKSPIYNNSDFNYVLMKNSQHNKIQKLLNLILGNLKAYLFFAIAIHKFDIFHYFFDGGILRRTLCINIELAILKLLGKKIILMPYGSDAFVYDQIPNPLWRQALMSHYPMHGNDSAKIQRRIRRMTQQADIIVACLVHFINLPRWDILPLTCYPINSHELDVNYPSTEGPITIAHATNHRFIKGTEYLIHAVNQLKEEGHEIILDIIEKVPNHEALERIKKADIYIDQLIFGYALAALEGMALGKVVVSAIDHSKDYEIFRQYSYLNECPIISANTQTIYDVLKKLFENRKDWLEIGHKSRAFVEKRHSYIASIKLYEAIYQKIWWDENIDLINFYHPLFEYSKKTTL